MRYRFLIAILMLGHLRASYPDFGPHFFFFFHLPLEPFDAMLNVPHMQIGGKEDRVQVIDLLNYSHSITVG